MLITTCFPVVNVGVGVTAVAPANIELFPNPAYDSFVLRTSTTEQFRLRILSLSGEVLQDVLTYESGEPIIISALPSGVYVVNVRTESGYDASYRLTKI